MTRQSSHVRGAGAPPLMEEALGQALDRAVTKWGDHVALISPEQDVRWTFGELAARTDALAAGLAAERFKTSDYLLMIEDPAPRYVRFVDEFPLTVTGKGQKFQIRRTMIEELGLTQERIA